LFIILDLITELNPYFEHPYTIWQLLLPDYNFRYEKMDEAEQKKHIDEAVNIWLKWIKNFCDPVKIEKIKKEDNLKNLWTLEEYKDPCKSFTIPFYQGYIYYFYSNDPLTASVYYKIASANSDALEWAKIMAAIMAGKWWNREKSFLMFLWLAESPTRKTAKYRVY